MCIDLRVQNDSIIASGVIRILEGEKNNKLDFKEGNVLRNGKMKGKDFFEETTYPIKREKS